MAFPVRLLYDLEVYSQDFRLRVGKRAPLDPALVFVAIDQPNYPAENFDPTIRTNRALQLVSKRYPWSREIWAIAVQRLIEAGAKVVALDIVFAGEGDGDDALKSALEKYSNHVVIAANYVSLEGQRGEYGILQLPSPTVIDTGTNHPMNDLRLGLVTPDPDPDSVVRRVFFQEEFKDAVSVVPPGVVIESLAARVLRQAGHPDAISADPGAHRFRFAAEPNAGFPRVPLIDVVSPDILERNYNPKKFFQDKIVIIGPAASIFHDEHRTPFGRIMLGPEIHLNFISAALNNQFLKEASLITNIILTIWAGLVAWLLAWRFPRLFQRFFVAVLCVALYLVTAHWLYDYTNLFIAVVGPVTVLLTASVTGLVYDFAQARLEKAQMRRTLERYVAKDVVRELIDNPQTYLNSLTGVRKSVTILFSDVRGFTSLTEGANAALLVKQLNEYFQEMVRIVVNHRGRLDKFIGDAVMADWGSFVSGGIEVDAERAVLSALQMRQALKRLNQMWEQTGFRTLAFGIGINHGEVVVGNLGSEEKMEVSVIGDPVNLASRLESLTKQYQLDLLLGESVAALVKNRFTLQSVDYVRVAGKTEPVEVFTVPPEAEDKVVQIQWLTHYEQGIAAYRQTQFGVAKECFLQAARLLPENGLIELYRKRCEELLENPPGPEWKGVFEMTKK